jgi:hypothetical protein
MVRGHATAAQNRASVAQGPPGPTTRVPTVTLHMAVAGPVQYPPHPAGERSRSRGDAGRAVSDDDDELEDDAYYPVSTPPPRANFLVKVNIRMTLEMLREHGLALYANYCTDSGVPFDPPSHMAVDYDVFFSSAEGAVQKDMPLLTAASAGGCMLRTQLQLAGQKPPMQLVMVPGRLWAQRHTLERDERARRRALHDHREAVMNRARVLATVSSKKAFATARNRARHTVLVEDIESALFTAFVALNDAALESQRVAARLARQRQEWEATARHRDEAAQALLAAKRRFLAGSANAASIDERAVAQSELATWGEPL